MTKNILTLTVNPAGRGYVNLATYVWGRSRPVSPATGSSRSTCTLL